MQTIVIDMLVYVKVDHLLPADRVAIVLRIQNIEPRRATGVAVRNYFKVL